MLVSTRIMSSGTQPKVHGRGSHLGDAVDPEARRVFDRPEDGRRQGSPWRRPRPAEIRAEQRANETNSSLSYKASAVRSGTVLPDSVTSAPFAALARTTEFWDLLGAAIPKTTPGSSMIAATHKSDGAKPSLADLIARAVKFD